MADKLDDILAQNRELQKLRLVIEQTPGAIFILDKQFRFEYVNPAYERLSGFSKSELIGRSVADIFNQTEYTEPREEIIGSMLAGEKWEGEMQTYRKDGSQYWSRTVSSPFRDDNGQLEGYIIIQQDVSDRKKIESELRESERFYRDLIENSLDAVSLNQDGRFVMVNSAFCKIFGYSYDEIISMNPPDFIAPEDYDRVMDFHNKRMNGELSHTHYKAHFIHKTGRLIYCDLRGTTTVWNGKNASFITLRDITEQSAMENALRESEEKYKTLVENSHDGIMIVRHFKVLYANDTLCNMLGYCLTEHQGDVVHPDDRHKIIAINELRRNGDTSTIHETLRLIAQNGEIKECEATSTMIPFDGDWAAFYTVHDVTERNRFEDKLRKSEQKYRELTEMLPIGVYELDLNGNITYINQAGKKLFNFDDQFDAAPTAMNFFAPEDSAFMAQNLKNEIERLQTVDFHAEQAPVAVPVEFMAKRNDGTQFPVVLYVNYILDDHRATGFRGIIIDISERKSMENALRESEKRYRTLIQSLQEGLFVIQDGKFVFLNDSIVDIVGYSVAELTGRPFLDVIAPAFKQLVAANHQLRVEGKQSPVNYEIKLLKKDGITEVPVILSVTVTEYEGKWALLGTAKDITERKNTELALQESEEKYRSLIENATDGIVIVQNGLLRFANQTMCDIMQYSMDELLNKPFLNYIEPSEHQSLNEFHLRRMTGEHFSSILRSHFIRKDKKVITVELNARTSNFNGSPAGFIIIRDITDRLKIENELQTAKLELEKLNSQLEKRVKESSKRLTEARTQLINLQKENLQSQYDVLKQQVNPHFLFNSLNVLTSLIKLEPDLAEKFSEQLSKVYRYVLENKDNELVDLNTELNFLDAYIFLLNIRFVGKLVVNLNIPEENRNNRIIPLAMQLLIENAIKHNVMSKQNPLVIDIYVDSENYLNVINNLQERPSQIVSTGVGLKNILNRYQLLNLTAPSFVKAGQQFVAKIKLVKNNSFNL